MTADAWPPKGLAKPAHRALAGAGIGSLEELARRREADVAALHGMGPNGVKALREALAAKGLSFAPWRPSPCQGAARAIP